MTRKASVAVLQVLLAVTQVENTLKLSVVEDLIKESIKIVRAEVIRI
jgi:hypothetical protein